MERLLPRSVASTERHCRGLCNVDLPFVEGSACPREKASYLIEVTGQEAVDQNGSSEVSWSVRGQVSMLSKQGLPPSVTLTLPSSFLSLTISPRGSTNIPFHTPNPIRKAIGSSYGGEAKLCSGEPFDIN
ncbi:hypothetical protein KC333_g121 [Hortaea werneckii]|nr:hypothetical protein KC333_g121 [Hortaea werneckii]